MRLGHTLAAGLNDLQDQIQAWTTHNGFDNKPEWTALGIVEEMGELAHAMLKQKQKIRGTHEEWEAKGKDAVGDIIVFLAHLCNEKGWSLAECLDTAWSEASVRDWIKFPTNGVSE